MVNTMNINGLILRIDDLIQQGEGVLDTEVLHSRTFTPFVGVSEHLMIGFRTASMSFILNLYDKNHVYYREFEKKTRDSNAKNAKNGIEILKSIKNEIEKGWLYSIKGHVSAEIFGDLLKMAEYLLEEDYKDPAAVIIGGVLEEHLRKLCEINYIPIIEIRDRKEIPIKADRLIAALYKADVYKKNFLKSILPWLDIRNDSVHGHYGNYSKEQVYIMLTGVRDFIMKNRL